MVSRIGSKLASWAGWNVRAWSASSKRDSTRDAWQISRAQFDNRLPSGFVDAQDCRAASGRRGGLGDRFTALRAKPDCLVWEYNQDLFRPPSNWPPGSKRYTRIAPAEPPDGWLGPQKEASSSMKNRATPGRRCHRAGRTNLPSFSAMICTTVAGAFHMALHIQRGLPSGLTRRCRSPHAGARLPRCRFQFSSSSVINVVPFAVEGPLGARGPRPAHAHRRLVGEIDQVRPFWRYASAI